MKDRSNVNFVIDGLLFLCLMLMAGIGLLLAYVLVPGREVSEIYGRRVWLTLFGWDRHDWGDLHLIIGYVFLGLLVLHLALHWKQILCMLERLLPHRLARIVAASVFGVAGLLALSFALLVNPDIAERGRGARHGGGLGLARGDQRGRGSSRTDGAHAGVPDAAEGCRHEPNRRALAHRESRSNGRMRGSWTLAEAASAMKIAPDELQSCLGLPAGTSSTDRLGAIRRKSGIPMGQLRRAINRCGRTL